MCVACLSEKAHLTPADVEAYIPRMAKHLDVRRGVDRTCARDFLLGHLNILGAVVMEEVPGVFSDACNKAIENGKPRILRDDWLGVFEPAEIAESIRRIT